MKAHHPFRPSAFDSGRFVFVDDIEEEEDDERFDLIGSSSKPLIAFLAVIIFEAEKYVLKINGSREERERERKQQTSMSYDG